MDSLTPQAGEHLNGAEAANAPDRYTQLQHLGARALNNDGLGPDDLAALNALYEQPKVVESQLPGANTGRHSSVSADADLPWRTAFHSGDFI